MITVRGPGMSTPLERFLNTVSFKRPRRVFFREFSLRKATLEKWYEQGLPRDIHPDEFFGFDRYWSCGFHVDFGPIPPYETVVLEETDRYVIVRDKFGATVKYFKVHDTGFDTRQWLDFKVKDRKDFEDVKKRFNPHSPKRYPPYWRALVRCIEIRDAPFGVSFPGQFWWTRDFMGLHGLLRAFYKQPDLVHEMMDFYTEFVIETLHPLLDEVSIDFVVINEDMAYKSGPMIGPSLFKEFMYENYKTLAKFLKEHGVKVVFWDSDGNPEPLLPLLIKAGINGFLPLEAAAGVDPVEVGRKYPDLVLLGGIDKRVLAFGTERDIEREIMRKVPSLLTRGGYIPTVDHAVPPEVSLKNYIFYLKVLKGLGVGPESLRESL
ncbi:MAG: hypothetical protein DRJ51_03115 [Thermoprotei archaeon]|nr:MAG: hypothetical protein DRJ51_03115 [Thermoprotei archaeon]